MRARVAATGNDQGQKHRKDRRPFDFTIVTLHGGGGQHFTEKQNDQPGGSFLYHPKKRNGRVRLVERLHAAEFLDVLCGFLLSDVEHVVHRDDANDHAARINDWQRRPIILAKRIERVLLGIGHIQRHECVVAKSAHFRVEWAQQKLAHSQVIDEFALIVDDVDHV